MAVTDDCTRSLFPQHGDAPSDCLELLPADGAITPRSIDVLAAIGRGRAAEVRLVACHLPDGRRHVCVEKVFRPGLLTRLVYRVAFQSPFSYQVSDDAILACFYRRRVAAAIVETFVPPTRVAEPLYARWDADAPGFVLGCEYIQGRGVVPQELDSHMLRRRFARWFGRESSRPAKPHEEMSELLAVMTKLEDVFHACGLTGTGWQVCKRALVSTANLLRTPAGYVVVDLESGIPAVLVPKYLFAGLRLGGVPLFDDLDPCRLRRWLDEHREQLHASLGTAQHALLERDAERLIEHSDAWKGGEVALGRTKWRVFGSGFRERFKARVLKHWRRREIIDEPTEAAIRPGRRIFSRLTFLLGLVPGGAGRLLQRLWANAPYRDKVRQFMSDREFRRQTLAAWSDKYTRRWQTRGRIRPTDEPGRFNAAFLLNLLLAHITPAALHRWLVDPVQRRNVLMRMFLICVSGRFQSEYGRHLIRARIRDWRRQERLSPLEIARLERQLDSNDMNEYVRCFGMHMGLKLLLPLLTPLKYGGGAMSLLAGNLWFLFFLLLMPVCRTAITVWRMIASKRPLSDYVDALVVGVLPVLGSLAYPVQMYSRYRELSAFLMRDSAARIGRWLPVYGGKDSRVELWAIKAVNVVAECLEVGLSGTAPLRRRLSRSGVAHESPRTLDLSLGRWHRLVDEQLRLIAESDAVAATPIGAISLGASAESSSGTRAA